MNKPARSLNRRLGTLGASALAALFLAPAGAANGAWTTHYLTSGLGTDSGIYGNWVAMDGMRVMVSDMANGAYVHELDTGLRQRLTTANSGDVAIVGDEAFVLSGGNVYVFKRHSYGLWYGATPLTVAGTAWAIAADEKLLAVSYDVTSTSGKVAIFEKGSSGSWGLSTTMGSLDDGFGIDLAIDDRPDYVSALPPYTVYKKGRLIVGAYKESVGGKAGAGEATIYEQQSATSWLKVAELSAVTPTTDGWFGTDVAISGDYAFVVDGDPYGSPGSVCVHKRDSGGAWSSAPVQTISLSLSYGHFGESIAATSDRLLVGVPYAGSPPSLTGYALLYELNSVSGKWGYSKTFVATGASNTSAFARAVAITDGGVAIGGASNPPEGLVHAFTGP